MRNTVAFIVPCRDKEPYVAECVESVLNQTYDAMTVVLSDQGSTDGSFDVMKAIADCYSGPKRIRLLQCPETEYSGMAGYNAHINWLMQECDEDLIIQTSADDIPHPERAEKVVNAWVEYEPSYIGTLQFGVADNDRNEVVNAPLKEIPESCFITMADVVDHRIGGKTSSAWTRELFEKHGPLQCIDCQDLIVPFWAGLENGFYFIAEWLHTYVRRDDYNNLGLEGRFRLAKDDDERMTWAERIHYQMCSNEFRMLRALEKIAIDADKPINEALTSEQQRVRDVLVNQLLTQTHSWVATRDQMTMTRRQPEAFPV